MSNATELLRRAIEALKDAKSVGGIMSDEKSLVEILRDPEIYYPGNCDTPRRMNALLAGLCQEAADKIEELESSKNEFIRLTEEEIETLGGDHVGPMSEGEFHLMVITQEALAEKNK